MKTLLLLTCTWISTMTIPFRTANADSIRLTNGAKLTGRIRGMERDAVLLEMTPVDGYPSVNQRIGKTGIARLEFTPDKERDRLAAYGGPLQISALRAAWQEMSSFLGLENSPAGRLGLRYGLLLTEAETPSSKDEALEVFSKISKQAQNASDRAAAEQGKLRTLMLTGRSPEAIQEAEALLKEGAEPALCAEAHLIVAGEHARKLRIHLEENPRWNEDERAGAERDKLRNLAIDSCLRAALGCESPPELAVRGLLGALQIYELCGDRKRALEMARDVAAIYPAASGVHIAREFLTNSQSTGTGNSPTPSTPDDHTSSAPTRDTREFKSLEKP